MFSLIKKLQYKGSFNILVISLFILFSFIYLFQGFFYLNILYLDHASSDPVLNYSILHPNVSQTLNSSDLHTNNSNLNSSNSLHAELNPLESDDFESTIATSILKSNDTSDSHSKPSSPPTNHSKNSELNDFESTTATSIPKSNDTFDSSSKLSSPPTNHSKNSESNDFESMTATSILKSNDTSDSHSKPSLSTNLSKHSESNDYESTTSTSILKSNDSSNSNSKPSYKIDLTELNLSEFNSTYQASELKPKFLIPFVSHFVGAGNQLMEFISAAVMARALNRTLCLTPLYTGPLKHGRFNGRASWGMALEERFELSLIKRYVSILTEDECLERCNASVDGFWSLRGTHPVIYRKWNSSTFIPNLRLDNFYKKWRSLSHIAEDLGGREERCVAINSIFPGVRWQGAYLSLHPFLQTSPPLLRAANYLRSSLHLPKRYLGVHWRFWESVCEDEELGLCFLRCNNGAIQNQPYLIPNNSAWTTFVKQGGCPKDGKKYRFAGVKVRSPNVLNAIVDRLKRHNLKHVYLATDANLRGNKSCDLLSEIVKSLIDKGIHTVGMVNCSHSSSPSTSTSKPLLPLPPPLLDIFSKIRIVPPNKVSNHALAVIEQEILRQSEIFLGSGQSTWSLSITDSRRMDRMTNLALKTINFTKISKNFKDEVENWPNVKVVNHRVDNSIIDFMLSFTHLASQSCVTQSKAIDKSKKSEIMDYVEEVVNGEDGWIEYDACESRLSHGETCEMAICWV